jgi:hypothetical protein
VTDTTTPTPQNYPRTKTRPSQKVALREFTDALRSIPGVNPIRNKGVQGVHWIDGPPEQIVGRRLAAAGYPTVRNWRSGLAVNLASGQTVGYSRKITVNAVVLTFLRGLKGINFDDLTDTQDLEGRIDLTLFDPKIRNPVEEVGAILLTEAVERYRGPHIWGYIHFRDATVAARSVYGGRRQLLDAAELAAREN